MDMAATYNLEGENVELAFVWYAAWSNKIAANEWRPNHIRKSVVYFIWKVIKWQLSKLHGWKRFHIRTQHCRYGYLAVITARQCVLKVSPICTVAFYCSALNKSVEGLLLQLTFSVSLAMASYRQTFPLAVMNYRIDHFDPTKKGQVLFAHCCQCCTHNQVQYFFTVKTWTNH